LRRGFAQFKLVTHFLKARSKRTVKGLPSRTRANQIGIDRLYLLSHKTVTISAIY